MEQHTTNKSSNTSIGVSIGLNDNGFSVRANAALSGARGMSKGLDMTHRNTHVDAAKILTLQSSGDTLLEGAVVSGEKVVADIGGNLSLKSLQDTSSYDSKQRNGGVGISMPIFGAGLPNASINAMRNKASGDYASVVEQTAIRAGDQGFNITAQGNTDLRGAVIASTERAADTVDNAGNPINQLITGSLTFSSLHNNTEAKATSDGLSLTQDLFSKYGAARTVLTSAHMHVNEAKSRSSITESAIQQGAIHITSPDVATRFIGEDSAMTISRDTQNANQPLLKLDAEALEKQVAKEAQQRAADVALVTRVTDDAYRVMFREPPRFYKAICPAGADCVKHPELVKPEEVKGTPEQIQIEMRANKDQTKILAVNGILNGVDRAIELAFQNAALVNNDKDDQPLSDPSKPTTIYLMHYIPANTLLGEVAVAAYEKNFASTLGYTTSDQGYADAIQAFGQNQLISLGHSRGTIVQNNAFNILQQSGFTNNQLSVRGVGGAVPVQQYTNSATAAVGASLKDNQISYSYFGDDPVPVYVTGNLGFATLRDLWTVMTGGDNTQHSCYGTGAAGCRQVEFPSSMGYQSQPGRENTLYHYNNGALVTTPFKP